MTYSEFKEKAAQKKIWLPTGFKKLDQYLGIGSGTMYLFGGQAGAGKTAIVDSCFFLDLYAYIQKQDKYDIEWVYFSLERPIENKYAKIAAYKYYKDTGIVVDVPQIMGWKGYINAQHILDKYDTFIEGLLKKVTFIRERMSPEKIYAILIKKAYDNGTHIKVKEESDGLRIYRNNEKAELFYNETIIDIYGKKYKVSQHSYFYVSKNPYKIIMPIIDHMGKISQEKEILDKVSLYLSHLRDVYGMSPILISQFNRDIYDVQRRIKTSNLPLESDFKGTGNLYEDADIALGLYYPAKQQEFSHDGYDMDLFRDSKGRHRFRSMTLMKNSYGADNLNFGLIFVGENGAIHEIDPPQEIQSNKIIEVIKRLDQ